MKRLKQVIYGWVDKTFLSGCSSYNSLAVRKSCRSKCQARAMFAGHGMPYAEGRTFLWPWTAIRFARKHGFPLVVKPNVSGFSRGSYFPLTSWCELWKALLLVKVWWPVSIIERYLLGSNYRVTVVQGEIMSVILRYPPFVDGDGVSSVGALIEQENLIRKEMGLYPVIQPIPVDRRVRRYLRKSGRSLATVPDDGERIYLFNRVALAPGGVVETVSKEEVHPDNREMFVKIVDMFGANILGIDAIFTRGINVSYKEQECILLEVNSRPYLKMHDVPRYGAREDLSFYYRKLDSLQVHEQDLY